MNTNRALLGGIITLALVACVVDECEAHPTAYISGCAMGKEVCVDSKITFNGSGFDHDGAIVAYQWSWPAQAYGESGGGTRTFSCKFSPAGTYTVSLRVKDDDGHWSTWKHCTVYAVDVVSLSVNKTTVNLGCDDDVIFTVTTNPSGHCGPVSWSGIGSWWSLSSDECQLTTHWDSPGTKTVTATCPSSGASKQVDVIGVSSVQWVKYMDNLPLEGGNKIFPGLKSVFDVWADRRIVVWVVATVIPTSIASGKTVYFKCVDPDDPSSDPLTDNNGDAGGDNFVDGTGLNKAGELLGTSAVTNASGVAQVLFMVSRQPGNNFVVGASTCEDRVDELTQPAYDAGSIPRSVKLSPILTTWRKLWIEQDSMKQVATTGSEMNHVEGTANGYESTAWPDSIWVKLGQNLPNPWDETDQFEWGKWIVSGFDPYLVRESTAYWWPTHDKVRVKPDAQADGVPMPVNYKLYDDDATTLPAYPSLGSWADKFEDAYIKIDYLSTSYRDEVTFRRHLDSGDVDDGSGDWNDDHDNLPTDDFWTVMVCTAFQPQREKDADPDSETPRVFGAARWSSGGWKNECAIYLETIREAATLEAGHVMAHEIGHAGGADDQPSQEGCIMWVSPVTGLPGDDFCGMCLREFREDPVY